MEGEASSKENEKEEEEQKLRWVVRFRAVFIV